jgi:hypothetical protein
MESDGDSLTELAIEHHDRFGRHFVDVYRLCQQMDEWSALYQKSLEFDVGGGSDVSA